MRTIAASLLLLSVLAGALAGDCLTICLEEDAHGCPPSCTHCVCCSHAQAPGVLLEARGIPSTGYGTLEAPRPGTPSSGVSPDILHVPRPPLSA